MFYENFDIAYAETNSFIGWFASQRSCQGHGKLQLWPIYAGDPTNLFLHNRVPDLYSDWAVSMANPATVQPEEPL